MQNHTRNNQGRFLPGVSGNVHGRPKRLPNAVTALADAAAQAVLAHDLDLLQQNQTDPRLLKEALDRLTRLGAKRITSESRLVINEAGIARLVEVITQHVTDPATLEKIVRELEDLGE